MKKSISRDTSNKTNSKKYPQGWQVFFFKINWSMDKSINQSSKEAAFSFLVKRYTFEYKWTRWIKPLQSYHSTFPTFNFFFRNPFVSPTMNFNKYRLHLKIHRGVDEQPTPSRANKRNSQWSSISSKQHDSNTRYPWNSHAPWRRSPAHPTNHHSHRRHPARIPQHHR